MTLSLLGDGVLLVALAWRAYRLSERPGATAAVGVALTAPQVVPVLGGGVIGGRRLGTVPAWTIPSPGRRFVADDVRASTGGPDLVGPVAEADLFVHPCADGSAAGPVTRRVPGPVSGVLVREPGGEWAHNLLQPRKTGAEECVRGGT